MRKSIFAAAACCVVLSGCQTWARTDKGFYSAWLQKPDPQFPNVFVVPPTEGKRGFLIVDQEPILLRPAQNYRISWALDALSEYKFKSIAFPGSKVVSNEICKIIEPSKEIECTFTQGLMQSNRPKLRYELTVESADGKIVIQSDPSIVAPD